MNRVKKLIAIALSAATVSGIAVTSTGITAGASGTGAGLAEYALNAYYEGWSYVWGGCSPGAVDCSGLIWSYCGGDRTSMLSDAQANGMDWGYVDSGIPRVHGLGLSRPGHVGVYIEDGMEVDARGSDYGVCYQQIGENGWNNWDCWFKLTAVTYPEEGWENFNGNYYYYEDGEYVVDTSRTIDGTTYYFDSQGHSSTTPSDTSATASSSESSSDSDKDSGSSKSQTTMWRRGSRDDEVVKIQTRLAELGYYDGEIDGHFGEETEKAFMAFQENAGLTPDGIAGADREVLYSDNAPAAKKTDSDDKKEETTEPEETEPEETEPEETVPEVTEPEETEPEETVPAETEPEETQPAEEEPTEAPTEAPVIVAQYGDFNDTVAKIQKKLTELGYYSHDTAGIYGDFTEEAVMNFQLANGLDPTGIVDAKTFEILFSDDAIESVTPAGDEETGEPTGASEETGEPTGTSEETEEPTGASEETGDAEETGADKEIGAVGAAEEEPAEEPEDIQYVAPAEEHAAAVEVTQPTSPVTSIVSNNNSKAADNKNANSKYADTASKTAAKANQVTAKALEKSAANNAGAQTADVKGVANLWLWLLVAAAILGIAAVVILVVSKKQAKAKESSTRSKLNSRW